MLSVDNVSKTYPNGIRANQNISLSIEPGEAVGLVGPNGSGKTTLIQQILGVLKSGGGSITIDGKKNDSSKVAYVPQFPAIYPALTVCETVLAALYYIGISKKSALARAEAALERAGLSQISKQYTYALSGGQKKLLSVACALAQEKPYLILDEATAMVDILSKENIWSIVCEEKDKGAAVLIASHDISEIKRVCSSFVLMKNGEIVFRGKPADIKTDFCRCLITAANADAAADALLASCRTFERNGRDFKLVTQDVVQMLAALNEVSNASEILGLECEHPAFYEGILSMLKRM